MLDRMARVLPTASARGDWTGHTGQADPQRRQHRHRRLRPRPRDGLRGAAPLQRARPDVPLRLERRRHRLRRGDARPRPERDAVHRLLEDVHDARDDDERAHGARVAARRARRRRGRGREALRRGVDERRARSRRSASTPTNMFGFWDWVGGRYSMDSAIGLSTMLAIGPEAFREMLAGFHAMDEHFRTAPFEREPAGADGPAGRLVHATSSAPRRSRCSRTTSTSSAFPRTCSSSTMESNGKSVTLDGEPVDYDDGRRSSGASRARTASTRFYQLIHQGTRLIPCDFIGFAHSAQPARRPPRPADRERVRAGGGARVRQDRRGGRAEGTPDWLVPHRTFAGNRPTNRSAGRAADAGRRSARSSRSTSTASSRRARSGASTPSTSGASSSARRSPSGSSPSSRRDEPEPRTTPRRTP